MIGLFQNRVAALHRLNRCPVCGSDALRHSSDEHAAAKAFFICGAVFSTIRCEPIAAELACPGPSAVAARALNAEAMDPLREAIARRVADV